MVGASSAWRKPWRRWRCSAREPRSKEQALRSVQLFIERPVDPADQIAQLIAELLALMHCARRGLLRCEHQAIPGWCQSDVHQ